MSWNIMTQDVCLAMTEKQHRGVFVEDRGQENIVLTLREI